MRKERKREEADLAAGAAGEALLVAAAWQGSWKEGRGERKVIAISWLVPVRTWSPVLSDVLLRRDREGLGWGGGGAAVPLARRDERRCPLPSADSAAAAGMCGALKRLELGSSGRCHPGGPQDRSTIPQPQ